MFDSGHGRGQENTRGGETVVILDVDGELAFTEYGGDPPAHADAVLKTLADELSLAAYEAGDVVARLDGWALHTLEVCPPTADDGCSGGGDGGE